MLFTDSISIVSFTPFLAFLVQTAYVLLHFSETLARKLIVVKHKFNSKIWSHGTHLPITKPSKHTFFTLCIYESMGNWNMKLNLYLLAYYFYKNFGQVVLCPWGDICCCCTHCRRRDIRWTRRCSWRHLVELRLNYTHTCPHLILSNIGFSTFVAGCTGVYVIYMSFPSLPPQAFGYPSRQFSPIV